MPVTWSIYTWNTQGKFTEQSKLDEINKWFPGRTIACIQEGGTKIDATGQDWGAFGGASVGAFNERCTNYVLVDKVSAPFATGDHHYLQNTVGGLVVGGGVAGRTPAAVSIGDILYVSWHSLSGKSNEDTALLVSTLESNPFYYKQYERVIIGGDFNTTPDAVQTVLDQGSDRQMKLRRYPYRFVVNSGQVTHPSSETELDFFIVLSKSNDQGLKAKRVKMTPSDHHAVVMEITF